MATLLDQLNELLPAGWRVTHLISLGPEWQANITDDEYVATGTGIDPEEAVAVAGDKAFHEIFVGRLFSRELIDRGEAVSVVDLRSLLGLNRPKITINRRI